MASQTSRGRKQDRARVAGGEDYEVRYVKEDGKIKGPSQEGRKEGRQQSQTCRAGPA